LGGFTFQTFHASIMQRQNSSVADCKDEMIAKTLQSRSKLGIIIPS